MRLCFWLWAWSNGFFSQSFSLDIWCSVFFFRLWIIFCFVTPRILRLLEAIYSLSALNFLLSCCIGPVEEFFFFFKYLVFFFYFLYLTQIRVMFRISISSIFLFFLFWFVGVPGLFLSFIFLFWHIVKRKRTYESKSPFSFFYLRCLPIFFGLSFVRLFEVHLSV